MDNQKIELLLEQYIKSFDELNSPDGNDEGYKWRAESCFTAHWDIDATDFPLMFKESMKQMKNLIDNSAVQPIGGINFLLKQKDEIEFVRECFRELYSPNDSDSDVDLLQNRIEAFREKINAKISRYSKDKSSYMQTFSSVLYYVCLRYPDKNYIFKYEEADKFANCVEYGDDFGCGQSFSLRKYYKMCDELLSYISENETLLNLHKKRFKANATGFDDKLHILVYDIIYCSQHYGFYKDGMITTSSKERAKKARLLDEIEAIESQIHDSEDKLSTVPKFEMLDMTGMNVLRWNVIRKTFDSGKIINQAGSTQTIAFADGEKTYLYPDAYIGGFLKVDDSVITMIKLRKNADDERLQQMKSISVLKEKRDQLKRNLQHIK